MPQSVSFDKSLEGLRAFFHWDLYALNPYGVPFLVTAIFVAVSGVYVFTRGGDFYQKFSFLVLSIAFSVWAAGTFIFYCAKDPAPLWVPLGMTYYGVTFMGPSYVWYVTVWLDQVRENRKMILAGYAAGFVLWMLILKTDFIVYGATRYFWGFHSRLTLPGGLVYIAFFSVYVMMFYWTLYRGYRKETGEVRRKQIRLVFWTFVIATLCCADFLPCYGIAILPIGGLSLFLAWCVLAYTVIHHKLFDIETVIHKTLMWVAASSLVFIPIFLLAHWLQPWYQHAAALEVSLLCAAVFFALTVYLKVIQPRVDHLFQRGKFDLEKASDRFIVDLVHLKNPDALVKKIRQTAREALYAESVDMFLYSESRQQFFNTAAAENSRIEGLSPAHPFVEKLFKDNALIDRYAVEADPVYASFREPARGVFQRLKADILIPLVLDDCPLGLIVLGRKSNLKRYTAYEKNFLLRLKNESTIALSNSLLYGRVEDEVRHRTRELVETQKQLIQAEKLATVGTLAGGVAHEINNPLTAILTNVQLLLTEAENELDRESLQLVEQATQRCRAIVKKLMVYARQPAAGEDEVTSVDPSKIVQETVDFLKFQFLQDNVEIMTCLEKTDAVKAGRNELEQVLTNLLVNSRDAIRAAKPQGKIEIRLSQKAGRVTLEIEDDGAGIRPENLRRIFDPFFTTKEVGKGMGLGLSICQSIVEKYQGTIRVDSAPGKGTVFTVQFSAARK